MSYCWADRSIADDIYNSLKNELGIELHRDIIDIGNWESIKEYMQSIPKMDYVILLISDSYLKSENCMYEVLEVLRDREFKNKIFPAVIDKKIYDLVTRVQYVKYWQQKYKELKDSLNEIESQNIGSLGDDLKRRQDIASNIANFLGTVADMNNPAISDIKVAIKEKLNKFNKYENLCIQNNTDIKEDYLSKLNISIKRFQSEPTDLEINQFIEESFKKIIKLLSGVAEQLQSENIGIHIQIEHIDNRTTIFKIYKNEALQKELKLFLGSMYGSHESIGVSNDTMSYSGTNSWNGMYEAKVVDGKLKLHPTLSLMNFGEDMTVEETAGHIWKNYIQIYLEN